MQDRNISYKCVALTSMKPDKDYLGTTVNSTYHSDTTLSKYVWDIKEKYNETLVLKWHIGRAVPS